MTKKRLEVTHRNLDGGRGLAITAAAFAGLAVLGSVAVGSYGVSSSTVLGAFTNTAYSVGSGPIQLREGVGSTACFSAGIDPGGSAAGAAGGTCDAIDDFGARTDQAPGGAATSTSITLTNVGSVSTTGASLTAGVCAAADAPDDRGDVGSDASDYCAKVDVTIGNSTPGAGDKCVFPLATVASCPAPSPGGTLASLANRTLRNPALSTLAVGASATYVITVELDLSATNADQGLTASLPLTWNISQQDTTRARPYHLTALGIVDRH